MNKSWQLLKKVWGIFVERVSRKGMFRRAEFFTSKIFYYFKGCETVLDLGCGSGHIGVTLAQKYNLKVTMIDTKPSLSCIGVRMLMEPCARVLAQKHKLTHEIYDGRKLDSYDSEYDAVLLAFVLHHTESPEEVLNEVCRVAKKRIIILEDIHRKWADRILNPIADAVINLEIPGHQNRNRSEEEWKKTFIHFGLKVMHTEFWGGPFFPNTLFVLEKE